MIKIFQYLQDKKGRPLPLIIKLIYNLTLNENDLTINSGLNLSKTDIISLPDNLTINGALSLMHCFIYALPNNLIVNSYLDIEYTKISELPEDLYVGGNLYCYGTPLGSRIKKNNHLLNKYKKQVKGRIIYE